MQNQTNQPTSEKPSDENVIAQEETFNTGNRSEFTNYYEAQSLSPNAIANWKNLKRVLLNFYRSRFSVAEDAKLTVLDVGCGAGSQSMIWAEDGHTVYGIDISDRLVNIGRERSAKAGLAVDLRVCSATEIHLPDAKIDVCIVPELLEHVQEWRKVLAECCRVIKPGGLIYISTTNALCPKQEEFDLPFYSWYPGFVKRICERKSLTTHPQWSNYATYPAVNWFTNPGLAKTLNGLGFSCYDRFDIMDLTNKPKWAAWLVRNVILKFKAFRYLAYFMDTATVVVGIKK